MKGIHSLLKVKKVELYKNIKGTMSTSEDVNEIENDKVSDNEQNIRKIRLKQLQ